MLEKISKGVKDRKKGLPVRFVYDVAMPNDMLSFIMKKLNMNKKDNAIPGGRYHNFKDFISFPTLGEKKLIYKNPPPLEHKYLISNPNTILKTVMKRDILLHYPYHTFNHIINLLREASIGPIVKSNKITPKKMEIYCVKVQSTRLLNSSKLRSIEWQMHQELRML